LLADTPLALVSLVATGPMAVFAAMLRRIVYETGTIEATSVDLADDTSIPAGRVPGYQRRLEEQGHILRDGEAWTIPGLAELAHKQTQHSGDKQTRHSGLNKPDTLACTNLTPKPSDLELPDVEPFSHPTLSSERDVCGSDLKLKGKKGSRSRASLASKAIQAGADSRVVGALSPMIDGLTIKRPAPDKLAFLVQVANGLSEVADADLATVAQDMAHSRTAWPSLAQMRQAVEVAMAARERAEAMAADPMVETLRLEPKPTIVPHRYGGENRTELRWHLTLNAEAEAEFGRLGATWHPPHGTCRDPQHWFKLALHEQDRIVAMAGRPLLAEIRSWVGGELLRMKQAEAKHARA
jgi:hypothetical protein